VTTRPRNGWTPAEPGTRVFIVSAIRVYADAVAQTLREAGGLEVVGTAADPAPAVARVEELEPDVVVVDVSVPHPFDAVRRLSRVDGCAKVVALGIGTDMRDAVAYAEAGASGFVTCAQSPADLAAAVAAAGRGETLCCPRTAAALVRRLAEVAGHEAGLCPEASLTAREREVAGLVATGHTNREIADRLCIEVATVKNHVHNILGKLGVARRDAIPARLGLMPARSAREDRNGSIAAGI
jgi:two-component system, NarL family, nitrate/nitrite response regulator NarL